MPTVRSSPKTVLHVGALALGALSVIVAAFGAGHSGSPKPSVGTSVSAKSADADLDRCRHLTPEHADEADCKRAWAAQRLRFFGHRP